MSEVEEKEGSAPSENSLLERSFKLWFAEALEIFLEGKKPWILDTSPTIDRDLHRILVNLWIINFDICFRERELGARGLSIERKGKLFFIAKSKESDVSHDQLKEERDVLQKYGGQKAKMIRALRLQGKNYPIFWLGSFPWFWTKSYCDELVETVNNYVKETEQTDMRELLLNHDYNDIERDSSVPGNRMTDVQEEIVLCKKVVVKFIEDLAKVKEMVAHDLGGVRYYFLRIAEITVPIAVFLTLIITVLRVLKEDIADLFRWLFE